jgi:hypothetical protein
VHIRAAGGLGQRLDDVCGRSHLRIAAAEVDERLALRCGCGGDAGKQGSEVLRR